MKSFTYILFAFFLLLLPISSLVLAEDRGIEFDPGLFIRNSSHVVEGIVTSLEPGHDPAFETEVVTLRLASVIEGSISDPEISFSYWKHAIPDMLWAQPRFALGDHVILLMKYTRRGWSLIGGGYGKFLVRGGMVVGTDMTVAEFRKALKDVYHSQRAGITIRFGEDSQSEGEFGDRKLGGEFSTLGPEFYGPEQPNKVRFYINPDGALDLNGNAIPFSTLKTVVQRALNDWNNVAHSYATFLVSDTPVTVSGLHPDGVSCISFTELAFNGAMDADFDSRVSEVDIILSKGWTDDDLIFRPLRWNTEPSYPAPGYPTYPCPYPSEVSNCNHGPIGPIDLEDVLVHELGHGVGLGHTGSTSTPDQPVYYYSMRPTDYYAANWWEKTWRRSPDEGDKSGKIYQDPLFASASSQSVAKILLGAPPAVSITGNFTVNAGQQFILQKGSKIRFGYGVSLTCNGSFKGQGTSTNRVYIGANTASPYRGYWDRIKFGVGSGPDTMTYCDLRYANFGVYVNNTSSNFFDHCSFDSCLNYGLYALNTDTDPQKACKVLNSRLKYSTNGFGGINARAYFELDTLRKNDQAVLLSSAKAYLYKTIADSNNSRAAYTTGSTAKLYLSPEGIANGCNTFKYNTSQEIYIQGGTAFIGNFPFGGANNIHNNGTYAGHLINNQTTTTVLAQTCYWGTQPNGFIGPVDTTNSSSTPWACAPTMILPSIIALNGGEGLNSPLDPVRSWITYLKKSVLDDEIEATRNLHMLSGFVEPGGAYEGALGVSWPEFLKQVLSVTSREDARTLAKAYEIQAMMDHHQYRDALKAISAVLAVDPSDEMWKHMVGQQLVAYIGLGELPTAQATLDMARSRLQSIHASDAALLEELVANATTSVAPELNPKEQAQVASDAKPSSFSLGQNYPNPFNPVTRISYTIPADSRVTLKVYDVLGQEVATLVDGIIAAGMWSAEFDASKLSSGIYFYQLTAGTHRGIRKMMLIK